MTQPAGAHLWAILQGVQPGRFTFPGFEQQAAAEKKNPMVPSNSQFSPNSTLFPLSSIESFDSGSVLSQVGLRLSQLLSPTLYPWMSPLTFMSQYEHLCTN